MRLVTHNGKFHGDEVMAIAILKTLWPEAEILRTREMKFLKSDDITVDVGGGEFDHHQRDFDQRRSDASLYSSAGLVWRTHGVAYIKAIMAETPLPHFADDVLESMARVIDDTVIAEIDRIDNGAVDPSPTCFSAVVRRMNPNWDEDPTGDLGLEELAFEQAVQYGQDVLSELVLVLLARARARASLKHCMDKSAGSKILILDKPMPWQEILGETPHGFVFVVHGEGNDWKVQTIKTFTEGAPPKTIKEFPGSWAGLEGDELANLTGIPTAKFCHRQRFIAGAGSMEDAVTLALKAL